MGGLIVMIINEDALDKELLQKRATKIANRKDSEIAHSTIDLVVFEVSNQKIAVQSEIIRAVTSCQNFALLPDSYLEGWLGLYNWHGQLVPVIWPKELPLEDYNLTPSNFIIIEAGSGEIAVPVQHLHSQISLDESELIAGKLPRDEHDSQLVKAIVGDNIFILDSEKLIRELDALANKKIIEEG